MGSALYWSRKLVAKGTITRMEFSNLFRELMALPPFEKPQSERPIPNFGYLLKSAYFALNLWNLVIKNLGKHASFGHLKMMKLCQTS